MRRNTKKIYWALLMLMAILSGCTSSNIKEEINLEKQKVSQFNFDSKAAVVEMEDGWVHYFVCEYLKETTIPYAYFYDAYNLKHKQLDDYTIKIVDENGSIIDALYASLPYMIANSKYENDFKNIEEFFYTNMPVSELTGKEADKLVLENLDKGLVIELYNKAISSEYMSDGKYYYLPEADIVQEDISDGYKWQIGYFIIQGQIVSINIELIYGDNIYLTDKVNNKIANDKEIVIAEMIIDIEKNIINSQSFVVSNKKYEQVGNEMYNRLMTILKSIEEGNYV